MLWLLLATLTGVVHVHHQPSHDSDAPFEEVLAAADAADLDFLVLTEHAPDAPMRGPLPAGERAGFHAKANGGRLLVLVGAEYGTLDGHLLALGVSDLLPIEGFSGRQAIQEIHAAGGFAVVPHPFTYGGWQDWEAPFDGLEVHNNAAILRSRLGPLLPFRLLHLALGRNAAWRSALSRPSRELKSWDRLLAQGRRVVAFSGADTHRNVSILGWRIDPYEEAFRNVRTVCPQTPLEAAAIWKSLRSGACKIRYAIFEEHASEARAVRFPSGRVELQLKGGRRVLEIQQPPF